MNKKTDQTQQIRGLGFAGSSRADRVAAGLLPMQREFVHLSTSVAMATEVDRLHDPHPVVCQLETQEAYPPGFSKIIAIP